MSSTTVSKPMSAAQAAQQHNRNRAGEYQEKARNEADVDLTAELVREAQMDADQTEWFSQSDNPDVIPELPAGPDGVVAEKDLVRTRRVTYLNDTLLGRAHRKVDAINRRLERAGVPDKFSLDTNPVIVRDSNDRLYETNQVIINTPVIQASGWTFAASITSANGDPDGPIIQNSFPGAPDLGDWRAGNATLCEHCGKSRRREKTYAVVGPDGQVKQLGSSCLQPFTGIDAATALRWMEWDAAELEGDDTDDRGSSARGEDVLDVRESVALALALSDGGTKYITKTQAEYGQGEATAGLVRWFDNTNRTFSTAELAQRAAVREQAAKYLADGTVDEVIAAGRTIEGDGGYAENLRTLMDQTHISARHSGTALSAVKVWIRDREDQAKKAAEAARPAPVKGWFAPVGESLKGKQVKATVLKAVHGYSYFGYQEKPTTMLIMQSESGHVFKWSTGGRDEEPGDEVIIDGGSVKEHSSYDGIDQTVLTRVKFLKSG